MGFYQFRPDIAPAVVKTTRRRQMNKTEIKYAQVLEARKRTGEIIDYAYEAVTLKLADDVRFTPDFLVWDERKIELHEVKGTLIREDARIKLRVAAAWFTCFTFRLCQFRNRSWTITRVTL